MSSKKDFTKQEIDNLFKDFKKEEIEEEEETNKEKTDSEKPKETPTEPKKESKILSYKNNEGNKLYGFSQSDLDNYNKRLELHSKILKRGIMVGGLLGVAFLALIVWIIWYVIENDVINNIVANCV